MSAGWGGMVVGHSWWGSPSGSGKSAVQLLQESKSRYVKSDRVLVSRQQPTRPDHLHINANPNIFLSAPSHTLHAHRPSPAPERRGVPLSNDIPQQEDDITPSPGFLPWGGSAGESPSPCSIPPPVPPRTVLQPLTSVALALHSGVQPNPLVSVAGAPPPIPARTPRTALRPRAKTQPVGDVLTRGGDLRRSLSHGPADKKDDVQMKLRKLLLADSKENLFVQGVSLSIKDKTRHKNQNTKRIGFQGGTFRAELVEVAVHKSLPDLPGAASSTPNVEMESENESCCKRRPSCPGAISLSPGGIPHRPPSQSPPPRPPRMFRDVRPPELPAKPKPRPPPRPPPPNRVYPAHTLVSPLLTPPSNGPLIAIMDGRRSSESSLSISADEHRRRPILRSKSDVTHERFGTSSQNGPRWSEGDASRRSSYCSAELEDFFDSLGLDSTTKEEVMSPQCNTPPTYFDELASDESDPGYKRGSSSSDEIRIVGPFSGDLGGVGNGPSTAFPKRVSEPSIVEKNARVIKWLFNCQKAMVVPPQRFGSNSS